jgi:hypothetical protein
MPYTPDFNNLNPLANPTSTGTTFVVMDTDTVQTLTVDQVSALLASLSYGSLDGGDPNSNYGGTTAIDAGTI